jgi:hypothetical protein
MREFTKSMMSYTWATSVFSLQQMVNLLRPQGQRQSHPATDAFNNAAQRTAEQMGDTMRSTFRAGDQIQRGMVDAMFGVLTLGMSGRGGQAGGGSGGGWGAGGGFGQQAAGMGQQAAEAFRQGVGAMGQAANVAGQAAGGAASGWGSGGGSQSGQTGWGPMPRRQE